MWSARAAISTEGAGSIRPGDVLVAAARFA